MDVTGGIYQYVSIRNFKETKVKEEILRALSQYAQSCKKLKEEIAMEVLFLDKEAVFQQLNHIAGYQGYMIEAPQYMILLSEKAEGYLENAGYLGQSILLKAQELGVDSCWITINPEGDLKQRLHILSSKEIVGLAAIGYGKPQEKLAANQGDNYSKADIHIVKEQKKHRLDLEEFVYLNQWGSKASSDELESRGLLDAFMAARQAPSALNRQPWRFIVDGGTVVLAVREDDFTNGYERKIDAGIVILYFDMVISAAIMDVYWKLGKPQKEYHVPKEYEIIGYCNL